MNEEDRAHLVSKLATFSNKDVHSCHADVVKSAVHGRCLSTEERDNLQKVVSAAGAGFFRLTLEAQIRMLVDRLRTLAPMDDRPREPIPAGDVRPNAVAGIPETGLTRTGKFDFRAGDRVVVGGLSTKPEANGAVGTVVAPGYDVRRGRVCVRAQRQAIELGQAQVQQEAVLHLAVRPCHLKLVRHVADERVAAFVRPRGDVEERTVGWCRVNGFDEVEGSGGRLWAGPWYCDLEADEREQLLEKHADASEGAAAAAASSAAPTGAAAEAAPPAGDRARSEPEDVESDAESVEEAGEESEGFAEGLADADAHEALDAALGAALGEFSTASLAAGKAAEPPRLRPSRFHVLGCDRFSCISCPPLGELQEMEMDDDDDDELCVAAPPDDGLPDDGLPEDGLPGGTAAEGTDPAGALRADYANADWPEDLDAMAHPELHDVLATAEDLFGDLFDDLALDDVDMQSTSMEETEGETEPEDLLDEGTAAPPPPPLPLGQVAEAEAEDEDDVFDRLLTVTDSGQPAISERLAQR